MKKAKKFVKIWLYWFLLFIVVFYTLTLIHEFSHAGVCKIVGGTPSIFQILPHPIVDCDGISINNHLIIPQIQYFFLAIIPYIIDFLLLIAVTFLIKSYTNLRLMIIINILLDFGFNYLNSLNSTTDFRNLANASPVYFNVAMWLVIIGLIGGICFLIKQRKLFKKAIMQSMK